MAEKGCSGLDDYFGHLDVSPIDGAGGSIGDEVTHLVQLQITLAEQSFEDGEDVYDQLRLG